MPLHLDVDQYIAAQPVAVRPILEAIRATVRQVAPEAEERISYGMPAFFQGKVLIYFGAFKNHIGVYPPVVDAQLKSALARYSGPKGNLRFPLSEPIPHPLIAQVVSARLREATATASRARNRSSRGAE